MPLTHFLCIPLVTPISRPLLTASLAAFRDDVTRPKNLGGFALPLDAVRPVGTIHLTLGTMSFPPNTNNNEGLQKAVDMLKSLRPRDILAGVKQPPVVMPGAEPAAATTPPVEEETVLPITLGGLHSMRGNTTVLFAPPVDPDGVLLRFCEKIRARFMDAGLLAPKQYPLLLHATIVNTVYVKEKDKGRGKKGAAKVINDARAIMDRYEKQLWMQDVPFERIAICRMGAKPIKENGTVVDAAYEVEAEIKF